MFATVAQKTMKESAVLSIEVRNVMKYKNHSTKLGVFFFSSSLRGVGVHYHFPIFVGVKRKREEMLLAVAWLLE